MITFEDVVFDKIVFDDVVFDNIVFDDVVFDNIVFDDMVWDDGYWVECHIRWLGTVCNLSNSPMHRAEPHRAGSSVSGACLWESPPEPRSWWTYPSWRGFLKQRK
jgi:hypothetical protein